MMASVALVRYYLLHNHQDKRYFFFYGKYVPHRQTAFLQNNKST